MASEIELRNELRRRAREVVAQLSGISVKHLANGEALVPPSIPPWMRDLAEEADEPE
jgi:hypothetical protein